MDTDDSVYVRTDRPIGIPGIRDGAFGTVSQATAKWARVHLENGFKETFPLEEITVLRPETKALRESLFLAARDAGIDMLSPTPTTALRRLIKERVPDLKHTAIEELTIADWNRLIESFRPAPKVYVKPGGGMRLRLG